MQFELITPLILKRCLSNLLANNYKKSYSEFRKFVKLNITEEEFEVFKKRKIKDEEIKEIISRTKINSEKEIERLKSIWNKKEKEIIRTIEEITGIKINTTEIKCYVDPYQNGGYYGEDSITVGAYKNPEDVMFVISHELFHIFYWKKLEKINLTKSTMGKEELFEWEIAEVTAHLLATHPKMRNFWQNIDIEVYPEIKEVLKKVETIWEENSFEEYLKKAYELLKK